MTALSSASVSPRTVDLLWWLPRAAILGLLAFLIFGPLANMLIWTVAPLP